MGDKIYVLMAVHNTAHGHGSDIIFTTPIDATAVRFARHIARDGGSEFNFDADDCGIIVWSLRIGHLYGKRDFETILGVEPSRGFPILFLRLKKDGEWVEEWPRKEDERQFDFS